MTSIYVFSFAFDISFGCSMQVRLQKVEFAESQIVVTIPWQIFVIVKWKEKQKNQP